MTTALTAGELTALAGPSTVKGYLSVYTPTSVGTALINGAIGYNITMSDVTIDTASANWTTLVKKGMTVKISWTGNVRYFRLRKDASSTTVLPIGESAAADFGLIPQETIDDQGVPDNANVTVYDQRDLWTALPRIAGGTVYEDYDLAYTGTGPNVQQWPAVNLGKHVSTYIGSASSTSLTFANTPIYFGTSAPSAGAPYYWVQPGSWTVTAGGGSATTNSTMTATVPAGQYWLQCDANDALGTRYPAYRRVWVHNDSNPPIPVVRASITKDFTGTRARLLLPDYAVASITAGVMVNYFEMVTFNGSATSVPSASTNVTGWITRIDYTIERGVRYAEVEIGGPAELLNRLGGYTNYLSRAYPGTPSTLQELYYRNCTVDYFIWYTILMRAPNLALLFDHHFFSTSETSYRFPYAKFGSGSLLRQLQELASIISCNYGFDSTGAGWVARHPSLALAFSPATRSTTRRETLSPDKYTKVSGFSRNLRPSCRKVRLEMFYYDGASVAGYVTESPGNAPGQGASEERIDGQVVSYLQEGEEIAGHTYAQRNRPINDLTFEIGGNRDVYEPARMDTVAYSWTAAQSPENAARSAAGTVSRVSKEVSVGEVKTTVTVEPLTQGAPGVLVFS